jgi:hypothetical protein
MSMNCTSERKDKCNLTIISSSPCGDGLSDEVVRWCSHCGAVVVDLDFDGRTKPGYFKQVQFPKIAKDKQ